MTATSNPTAIAMIAEMLDTNASNLTLAEQMLAGELCTLEQRIKTVRESLEQGHHIDTGWLREGAHKAEERISQRKALYAEQASLKHVMKAAGGDAE